MVSVTVVSFEDEDGNCYTQRLDYKGGDLVFSKPIELLKSNQM